VPPWHTARAWTVPVLPNPDESPADAAVASSNPWAATGPEVASALAGAAATMNDQQRGSESERHVAPAHGPGAKATAPGRKSRIRRAVGLGTCRDRSAEALDQPQHARRHDAADDPADRSAEALDQPQHTRRHDAADDPAEVGGGVGERHAQH